MHPIGRLPEVRRAVAARAGHDDRCGPMGMFENRNGHGKKPVTGGAFVFHVRMDKT